MNLPYRFPDHQEEARRRCQAFQRLSVTERLAAILDTVEVGMYLRSVSPRRDAIDQLFHERETAAQQIQRELIRRHA